MNKNLAKAFVAVKDNRVIVFETNLKGFIDRLLIVEPKIRNYAYYVRQFEKQKEIEYINDKGEIYNLQQVFP